MAKKIFFAIIGLGKTGLSAARYLQREKIPFVMMDSRAHPPEETIFRQEFPDNKPHLGLIDFAILDHAQKIILSPGMSPHIFFQVIPAEKIISDIELFAANAKAPIIGITGTNAKGTVTTLLGEMIKQSGKTVCVGGNIGTPALDLLLEPTPDFYVLEISSFQLEITHHLPLKAAVILNLSPDHLDRHTTFENYANIKQRIYRDAHIGVFNREDKLTRPVYPLKSLFSFGLSSPASKSEFGMIGNKLSHEFSCWLSIEKLKIKGKHNWLNALAALALGYAIGLPYKKMLKALAAFRGLEHRCEWIISKNHITWYNDSKGTNIGATLAALEGFGSTLDRKARIILIMGGMSKKQDFSLLKKALLQYTRKIILIGQDAGLIDEKLRSESRRAHDAIFAASLEEAVDTASKLAQKNDIVLLSPACASFDMFKNFEDRGNQFKLAVLDQLT